MFGPTEVTNGLKLVVARKVGPVPVWPHWWHARPASACKLVVDMEHHWPPCRHDATEHAGTELLSAGDQTKHHWPRLA